MQFPENKKLVEQILYFFEMINDVAVVSHVVNGCGYLMVRIIRQLDVYTTVKSEASHGIYMHLNICLCINIYI